MSKALAVYHGPFGRATLYQLDRDMATHAHREGHLTFHVGGRVTQMCVDGIPHILNDAYGTAINPWQSHSFTASDPENGSVFLVLYIRPEWFQQIGRSGESNLKFGSSVVEMTGCIRILVDQVTSMLLYGAPDDFFDGYLFELTQACFDRSWSYGTRKMDRSDASQLRDFRIRNSIKVMKSRLGEGETILLQSIARESGLSRPHFFKLFKENTGLTPNIYLNTLRMESAIEKLTLTGDAVTSIGLDLGFSSQASFTRFFASNVGIPPSDYRRVAQVAA